MLHPVRPHRKAWKYSFGCSSNQIRYATIISTINLQALVVWTHAKVNRRHTKTGWLETRAFITR